jgi:hypothetical protein
MGKIGHIGLLVIFLIGYYPQIVGQSNEATVKLSLGITEAALIKVNTTALSMQLKPRDAGLSLETSTSDSTARLLISSVVSSQPRTLSARISEGVIPSGSTLKLVAQPPNASFVGVLGTFTPPTDLDAVDKPIITQIMTCYSGKDLSDGYVLKFIFAIDALSSNYGSIRATNNGSITVALTLTAAQ